MPRLKNKPIYSTRASLNITPNTMNIEARTVDFVLSTDQPVKVVDWERYEMIDEILVPSGVTLPRNKQIPLADTHDTSSINNVLGSVRNIRLEDVGLVGTLHFANDEQGQRAFDKVKDGHITDGSVGYQVKEYRDLKADETFIVGTREYTGESKLVTAWRLFEFSLAPIGADDLAKARSEQKVIEEPIEDINIENTATQQERAENELGGQPMPKKTEEVVITTETVDVKAVQAETRAETKKLLSAIRTSARAMNMSTAETDELLNCDSIEQANARMIEIASQRTTPIVTSKVEVTADEHDKFRSAACDGILMRAGVQVAKPANGATSIRFGFKGLARECLERAGVSTRGMSDEQILAKAISQRSSIGFQSTSDFSNILMDASNKAIMSGYDGIPSTFESWCKIGSVSDFKTHNRVRISDSPEMGSVGENGELPRKSFSDQKAVVSADTVGLVWGISRQAFINDDLSILSDIPGLVGARARQQVNAYAYSLLSSNLLSDGSSAIFSSDNGNLASSGAVPSATTLSAMRVAMMQQTDISGTKLNMSPMAILCGPESMDNLMIILSSELMPDRVNAKNPVMNMAQPIIDANITGKEWYGVASPMFPTVEIVFLNGQRTPTIEQLPISETLGMSFRAFLDYGGSVLDYRGLYKNEGE